MGRYLDNTGLGRLWAKCKSTFAAKANVPTRTVIGLGRTSTSEYVDWYKQILSITQSNTWSYFYAKIYVEDQEGQKCYAEFVITGRSQSTIDDVTLKIEKLAGYGTCELLAKHNSTTHVTEVYLKVNGSYVMPIITLEQASSNISFYNSGSWTQSVPSSYWTSARNGLFDSIYPVGSIYMSINSTNPSILFGGTWERINGRFLLGAGNGYNTGATGGSSGHTPSGSVTVYNHTLTVNEMPSHMHDQIDGLSGSQVLYCQSNLQGVIKKAAVQNNTGNSGDQWSDKMKTSYTGGGQGHNHSAAFSGTYQNTMPPYFVVYMWQRTA